VLATERRAEWTGIAIAGGYVAVASAHALGMIAANRRCVALRIS
jgi:hypothetical protein